jgi:hypothetical protein
MYREVLIYRGVVVLFLFFLFELGKLFLGLLIEALQLLGCFLVDFFNKFEDRFVVIFEKIFCLWQVTTQQHSFFRVKDNGNEFDIRVSVYLYQVVRIEF